MIQNNDIILLQGDSITDCGRARDAQNCPNDHKSLGQGYAMMAAAELLSARPTAGLRIFNRGISGNRVVDLHARIQPDFIGLKPSLVSILIGVNDTWHKQINGGGVAVPEYERVYRKLLKDVRTACSGVKFVLCEPFVLRCGVVADEWIPEINQRRVVVAGLAEEFDAVLVPFQGMFDEAVKEAPPEYWASDGVHPTVAGHSLMAKTWLKLVTQRT